MFAKNKNNVKIYAPKHDDDKFNQKDKYFAERGYYKLNQTLDYDSFSCILHQKNNVSNFYAGGLLSRAFCPLDRAYSPII